MFMSARIGKEETLWTSSEMEAHGRSCMMCG